MFDGKGHSDGDKCSNLIMLYYYQSITLIQNAKSTQWTMDREIVLNLKDYNYNRKWGQVKLKIRIEDIILAELVRIVLMNFRRQYNAAALGAWHYQDNSGSNDMKQTHYLWLKLMNYCPQHHNRHSKIIPCQCQVHRLCFRKELFTYLYMPICVHNIYEELFSRSWSLNLAWTF